MISLKRMTLRINNGEPVKVYAEVRTSALGKMLGLMFRRSMKRNQIMIFRMGRQRKWSFHTNHMSFPIDVIGISENGFVLDIEQDVKPDVQFSINGFDVIEFPAGFVERNSIMLSDAIVLGGLDEA